MNRKKRLATIQIDVDGLWVIFQHFGHNTHLPKDIMYESAFPRFLDLFDEFNIKATLFVVGKDCLFPARLTLLKDAVRRGHEIANHTMSHAEGFSYLSKEEKIKQIQESGNIIETSLGVKPVGFRTPSNDVDEETLLLLEEQGYEYDSSLMPTYYGPLLKKIKFFSLNVPRKDNYLGKWIYGFSPLQPYHPSYTALHKKGEMRLVEVPITTMPFLRCPFHTSFVFAAAAFGLGTLLFDIGFSLLRITSIPLNFVFHTNELSDPIEDAKITRQFGLSLPVTKKKEICHHVLNAITQRFRCVTTREYAKACTGE